MQPTAFRIFLKLFGYIFNNKNPKKGSRGKTHWAAGELVFGVNNPAVFL